MQPKDQIDYLFTEDLEMVPDQITCATCGRTDDIPVIQGVQLPTRIAQHAGPPYRLVAPFGWICQDCNLWTEQPSQMEP